MTSCFEFLKKQAPQGGGGFFISGMDAAEIAFDSFEKQNCQSCFKHGCLKQRILRVKKVGFPPLNHGYRDYSPKTARFTTVDPIRDGHNWYAYCSNDPVNFVDAWGLEDIVIFSAINNKDNFNNIGYSLLVNDSYKKIKKAAKKEGLTVRIVNGTNATKDQLKKELENDETKRLIIVAHGDDEGYIYDQKGDRIDNVNNIAGANLEIYRCDCMLCKYRS